MEKKKMTNKEFKEFIKTPRGKATMFFGAYLLFFLFIAIFARTGGTSGVNKKYETGSPFKYNINDIANENYKFNYSFIVDGVTTNYEGSSTKTGSLFTVNGVSYYFNGSNYFTNTNGIWLNVSNPYNYEGFVDAKKIGTILEKATYISKTEFEDGREVYTFNISSATINNIFENSDLDIEELPNEITISVDDDNNINEIKYTLDSYCKAKGICIIGMNITLKYEDVGKVEEIISPLE